MPLPKARSNSLFSDSFFIFITRFFPSLANLLVLIWYSRQLTTDTYGNYQHFWIQLNVIYPLICLGIHVLIITYPRAFINSLLRRISSRQYALYAVWALLLGAAFAYLQAGAMGLALFIPFLYIVGFALSTIMESFIIVCKGFKLLSMVNLLYAAGFCFIHWYALQHTFAVQPLFFYLLVILLLRLFVYGCAAWVYTGKDATTPQGGAADISNIRSLWMHLGVYDVSQMLFSWVDKFAVSLLLAAPVSAVYFNGAQNIPFLPLLLSAAGSAVLIQLATGNGKDERDRTIDLMLRSGRMLSCIVFPVFCYLLLFRSELFSVVFAGKYASAVPVFAISLLALPVRAYSFTTVLQRMHKGAIINAGAVADLVLACALMYPLYRLFGLPGIALSFVITTYLQAAFYLFYSARLLRANVLKMIPLANWLAKLIVFATVFISIHYVVTIYFNDKIALLLGGVTMMACVGLSLLAEFYKQRIHGEE